MKGIVCEAVESFKYRDDLPEPELGAGEAIVQIRRVGICGTDLHAFKGNQPFFSYPRVLGHELSGTVVQAADGTGLQAGDQVAVIPYLHCGECIACRSGKTNCCTSMKVLGVHVDGGMRERIAVPATHLIRTAGLSLDESAMLEPLAIGAHAVRRSRVTKGETVLVIGAGPIGLGVMAFAKYAGARVIAMDVNEERLAFCRSWAAVDGTVNALEGAVEQLEQLTSGDYPTIVFDATGNAKSMEAAFRYVAHGGTLVYVGLVKNDLSFSDTEFHKREMTLMGSRNATKADFDHVLEVLKSGSIDIGRYVTHRSSFEQMAGQFDTWLNPASKVIKAVVEL
ncbi:zinc-binding alcohol dehydrogenase family protein [Paenibacillus pasadenensis]|uniref:zinc-binding alcohol dehydrogenase family protein n=1 Tax=Paenibacillus pasadenensis TaxID=217090 RepID=UPI00203DF8BD|nr:zinc-binding alcohol dehydrogenase family protein [Paenibacillus pasadenensis]MCM3748715.1 zinc-binding alcohol dehydrogenase family protein [Paenibacillus pasadenensis]